MRAFDSMKDKLSKTGLYQIEEGSMIYNELAAYAVGLDIIYSAVEELIRECFVQTAVDYGLTVRESILRKCNTDLTVDGRRNAITAAMSIGNIDNTVSALGKYPKIFNINGEFTEKISENKIVFTCDDVLTDEQKEHIEFQMGEYMPCWLDFEFTLSGG